MLSFRGALNIKDLYGAVPSVIGGAAPYVGILDGYSPTAAYAFRQLRSDYEGDCTLMRRDSDDDEEAFGFTSAGELNVAAVLSWRGAANAYHKILYDQSGNARDATQTTNALQPLFVESGFNAYPVMRFDGVGTYLVTPVVDFSTTQAVTVCSVLTATSGTGQAICELGPNYNAGTGRWAFFAQAANQLTASVKGDVGYSTAAIAALHATTPKSSVGVMDKSKGLGQECAVYLNGVEVIAGASDNTNAYNAGDVMYIGMRGGASLPFTGDMSDLYVFSTALSAEDRQAIEADFSLRYGLGF